MAKSTFLLEDERTTQLIKRQYKRVETLKKKNLFMSNIVWKNCTHEQNEFINEELWNNGCIAVIKPHMEIEELMNDKSNFAFVPFAPSEWNIYNFPLKAQPINFRNADFIPNRFMEVNKEIVLGYALSTHTPIRTIVEHYIDILVDIDMTIRTNLKLQKMPYIFKTNQETRARVEEMLRKVQADCISVGVQVEDLAEVDALSLNVPYIIDQLYAYKKDVENELLTIMGIDNVSIEKKERLITDEANANNDLINDYNEAILDNLKAFAERAKEVLNVDFSVETKHSPKDAEGERNKDKTEVKDNDTARMGSERV